MNQHFQVGGHGVLLEKGAGWVQVAAPMLKYLGVLLLTIEGKAEIQANWWCICSVAGLTL